MATRARRIEKSMSTGDDTGQTQQQPKYPMPGGFYLPESIGRLKETNNPVTMSPANRSTHSFSYPDIQHLYYYDFFEFFFLFFVLQLSQMKADFSDSSLSASVNRSLYCLNASSLSYFLLQLSQMKADLSDNSFSASENLSVYCLDIKDSFPLI